MGSGLAEGVQGAVVGLAMPCVYLGGTLEEEEELQRGGVLLSRPRWCSCVLIRAGFVPPPLWSPDPGPWYSPGRCYVDCWECRSCRAASAEEGAGGGDSRLALAGTSKPTISDQICPEDLPRSQSAFRGERQAPCGSLFIPHALFHVFPSLSRRSVHRRPSPPSTSRWSTAARRRRCPSHHLPPHAILAASPPPPPRRLRLRRRTVPGRPPRTSPARIGGRGAHPESGAGDSRTAV